MASHSGSSTAQAQSNQIQTNVIKTMIIVSACYAIFWLPCNIYCLLATIDMVPDYTFFNNGDLYSVIFFWVFSTTAPTRSFMPLSLIL